jgi:hypothetical protein
MLGMTDFMIINRMQLGIIVEPIDDCMFRSKSTYHLLIYCPMRSCAVPRPPELAASSSLGKLRSGNELG